MTYKKNQVAVIICKNVITAVNIYRSICIVFWLWDVQLYCDTNTVLYLLCIQTCVKKTSTDESSLLNVRRVNLNPSLAVPHEGLMTTRLGSGARSVVYLAGTRGSSSFAFGKNRFGEVLKNSIYCTRCSTPTYLDHMNIIFLNEREYYLLNEQDYYVISFYLSSLVYPKRIAV